MTLSTAHPDADLLTKYNRGVLEPDELREVEEHILACDSCCGRLQELPADSFVEVLRSCHASEHPPEHAGPQEIGERAAEPSRTEMPPKVDTLATGGDTADDGDGLSATLRVSGTEAETSEDDAPRPEPAVPAALAAHPRYHVKEVCGVGGMGAVYRAEHRLMGRDVALKIISPKMIDRPEAVERFEREVRAAARLAHPNIVTAHDAEQVGGLHLLVMEYVEGHNLAEEVARRGPLPVAEACDDIRQAALGLQHASAHGMVHRDIKPHNLMLTPQGQVKILDFGLANFVTEELESAAAGETVSAAAAMTTLTHASTTIGTPDYIAPEQIRDAHAADIRADIYSLGCTLYFLLAGRPPFPEGNVADKLRAHAEEERQPISELRNDIPPELAAVLQRMMARNPAERYQTPAEVAEALERFAQPTEPSPTLARKTAPQRPPRPLRRWTAVALIFLAIVFLGVVFYIQTDTGRIVIQSDDPHAQILVERLHIEELEENVVVHKRPAEQVAVLDAKNSEIKLRSGHYVLRLRGTKRGTDGGATYWSSRSHWMMPDGRHLRLSEQDPKHVVTLRRRDRIVVHVPPPAPQSAPASVEYDLASLAFVRQFEGHTGTVTAVDVSPNGQYGLSGGGWPDGDGTLRLWDLASGEEVRRFEGHEGQVLRAFFSPDGRRIVSGGSDRTARVWDVDTGQEIAKLTGPDFGWVHGLAFTPDGKRVLVGPGGGKISATIALWDFESDTVVKTLQPGAGSTFAVAVSPDGRRALTGHGNEVFVWDLEGGIRLGKFVGHANNVQSIDFSQDGRQTLTASLDGTIRLWDVESGREVRRYTGHTDCVTGARFLPGDRFFVSGSFDRTVRVWDVRTGREAARSEPSGGSVWGVGVTPDGKFVLSGGGTKPGEKRNDFDLRLWFLPDSVWPDSAEASPQLSLVRKFEGHTGPVKDVGFSPDGQTAVSGSGWPGGDGTVRLWDVSTGKQIRLLGDVGKLVTAVCFSPDGKRVAGSGFETAVHVWDIDSGREIGTFPQPPIHVVEGLAFSPDGRHLLSISHTRRGKPQGHAELWDTQTGRRVWEFDVEGWLTDGAFLPDGERVLVGGHQTEAAVYELDRGTGRELRHFPRDAGAAFIEELAVSADGRFVAAAVRQTDSDQRPPTFSATGQRIATPDASGHVWLWDVETGKKLGGRKVDPQGLLSIAFTPDGRRLLVGSHAGILHLLDAQTLRSIAEVEHPSGSLWDVAIAPDGRYALTAGGTEIDGDKIKHTGDYALRLWRLPESVGQDKPADVAEESPPPLPESAANVIRSLETVLERLEQGKDLTDAGGLTPELREDFGRFLRMVRKAEQDPTDVEGRTLLLRVSDQLVCKLRESPETRKRLEAVVADFNIPLPRGLTRDESLVWGLFHLLYELEGGGPMDARSEPESAALREVRRFRGAHVGAVNRIALSSDGGRLLSAGADGTARLWDVASGKELRPLLGHRGEVKCVAFSPDGKQILTGDGAGTVRLWDADGKLVETYAAPGTGAGTPDAAEVSGQAWVSSVTFAPDGRLVAFAALDYSRRENVRIGLIEPGRPDTLRTLAGVPSTVEQPTHRIWSLAFSPNGERIFAGGEFRLIGEWETQSGRFVRQFRNLPSHPYDMALSSDGKRLVTRQATDHLALLWDVPTGQILRKFEGHGGHVNAVAISPDGRLVATGSGGRFGDDGYAPSEDNSIRLWNAQTGEPLVRVDLPQRVTDLAFTPDGKHLVSSGGEPVPDATADLRLWQLPDNLVAQETEPPPE